MQVLVLGLVKYTADKNIRWHHAAAKRIVQTSGQTKSGLPFAVLAGLKLQKLMMGMAVPNDDANESVYDLINGCGIRGFSKPGHWHLKPYQMDDSS